MAENISQTQKGERRFEERRGGDRPISGGKEGRNPYPPKEIGGKGNVGKENVGKDMKGKEYGRTESNTSGRDLERDRDTETGRDES